MTGPTPAEAALAVARATQMGALEGLAVLGDYLDEGMDPDRLAYVACQLLSVADARISGLVRREEGDWLRHMALAQAKRSAPSG